MEYALTRHSMDALKKREIPLEWVEITLRDPEWIEPDLNDAELQHRLRSIPDFQDRVLRVIVNVVGVPPRVVSVYFDRRRRVR